MAMQAASPSPSVPNLHSDESEDATVSCICSVCSTQPRNVQPAAAPGAGVETKPRAAAMWLGMWWDAWVRPVARLHWLAPEALAWVPCAPPSCTLLDPQSVLVTRPLWELPAGHGCLSRSLSTCLSVTSRLTPGPCLSSPPSCSDDPTYLHRLPLPATKLFHLGLLSRVVS
jgi:hypothetical protein